MLKFSENFKEQFHQSWFGGCVGALLSMFVGVSLLFLSFGKGLEDWSFDLPFLFRSGKPVENIVIIYLDEDSYKELGQSPSTFDRGLHARLLNQLKAAGAKLVAFDIFFDPNRPVTEADKRFAGAMRAFGPVVIGAQVHYDNHLGSDNLTFIPPLDLFRDAAAGLGVVKIAYESDTSARKHHPGTAQVPSLAWKAAELAGVPVAQHPEKRGEPRWLNYYSPEPFQGFSYSKVLSHDLPADFSFRDKFVFVGSGDVAGFSGEEKEQFRYPWTWRSGNFSLGVEIHALTFANLLRRDWLTRWPMPLEALLIGIVGALLGYSLSLFRPFPATGIALLTALGLTAFAFLLMARFNVWVPWMIIIVVQIPIALAWSYLFHSIRVFIETALLQHSLELYLSPKQVKQILKNPQLLRPGGEQKIVSILFSDIAGFSKISERMDSDDLVKLLNSYYETTIACIHQTEGTVLNIIGDAILAVWNAPQDQGDHQERACRAALLLNQSLVHFDLKNRNLPLRTRIGLHCGTVCVGNIGSTSHFAYAAIGESVNMASRLEGLNKHLNTNILATRDIQKSTEGRLVSRFVGHFRFKGFDQVVQVHELIDEIQMESQTHDWREAFETALHRFQRGAFDEAENGFRTTMKLKPDDGPSKFYLERIARLRLIAPPSEWQGEIELQEK
ncbi:MAG: adenylate/guanylate cyclase domain-containing protein [Verrucomicrobiota bacterium]